MLSMAWREMNVCDERRKFINDWLKREFTFSELCIRFGISRKTGYKFLNRFRLEGNASFMDESRARLTQVDATSNKMIELLLNIKHRYPLWGPRKVRDFLILNAQTDLPATSTIGNIFKQHGLVKPRKTRLKTPPHTQPLKQCNAPNVVWSADFNLGDGQICHPLTITDNYSRYLLSCFAMPGPRLLECKQEFHRIFAKYGLPDAIRTDNGQPFAGLCVGGLTQLSIWWLKLGITPE